LAAHPIPVRLRTAGLLIAPAALVLVALWMSGWPRPIGADATVQTGSSVPATTAPGWHVHLISTADLEGPPVVVPGTEEALALHGNDGEEVATQPLERVNLVSGDVTVGPRVPDDALLAIVGSRVVLLAPANYSASGVVTLPWSAWTIDPTTLRPQRPARLPFVSTFGVVVPSVEATQATADLWVSDGRELRLVDLASGLVRRTVAIPGLELSIDPTGRHLYVVTGTGGSTTAGSTYRPGTIVELDERTGLILATSAQWTSSPQLRIAASEAGVYLLDTGRAHRAAVFLEAGDLRSVTLPTALESGLARTFERGDDVTMAPDDHGAVFGSPGRLTCVSSGANSPLAITALAPEGDSWEVFGQRGATLFAWDSSASPESPRIDAITAPPIC
jgi:hypothetical protein